MLTTYLPIPKIFQSSANIVLKKLSNLIFGPSFFLTLPQSATTSKLYQFDNIFRFYLRKNSGCVQESTAVSPTVKFISSMISAPSSLSYQFEFGLRELESSRRMMIGCWTKPFEIQQGFLLKPNSKYELPSGSYRLPSKCRENGHMPVLKPKLVSCEAEATFGLLRSGQKNVLVSTTLAVHNRSLQYSKVVSGCLRNRDPCGKNMFYKCFWSDMPGSILKPGYHLESWMKNFSSSSTPCSTGAASNVSIDGISYEDKLDNSGASSDVKFPSIGTLKLLSGSCYLPHPEKEETGGEDAHFISSEQAIGVADGVGGWADLGVNAGHYARELMSHSISAIAEEPKGSIDPARVLEKAYINTKARGSSTACIVALTNQGIHAVNLGDSGFIVVRDGCAVFKSPVQQHDFNFTYQLESGNASDLPSSGQVFTLPVMSGDVIVAGTDGLFDNLYTNEVTAVVLHAVRESLGPQATALKIAALARQRALDRKRQTPFSDAAHEAGYRYCGGKLDDITVVVSYVTAAGT